MEQASNIFTDGLNTDLHPLTTPENTLTDALNATTITFNGNEFLLLNDMGNSLIRDSKTGNVMGLSDGFIPTGMKEHGGILYITSLNTKTGKSEIGTIPSPLIKYTYEQDDANTIDNTLAESLKTVPKNGSLKDLYNVLNQELIIINSEILFCGDQFIIILDLESEINNIYTKFAHVRNTLTRFEYPAVTKLVYDNNEYKKLFGWYDMCLYSMVPGKQPVRLTDIENTPQEYFTTNSKDKIISPYWFILKSDLENTVLDIDRCRESNLYRKYPNIKQGLLAVKLELNVPENISMLQNYSSGLNTPFTFCKITKTK